MPTQDDAYDFSLANAFGLQQQQNIKQTSRLLSLVKEVFNCTYAEIGLDRRLRPFIDALIGASRGRCDWFECGDQFLAERLFSDELGIGRKTLRKRCERDRKKILTFQSTKGYRLIETDITQATYHRERGGDLLYMDNGLPALNTEVTRYRLPILSRAEELFDAANLRKSPAEFLASKLSAMLRFIPEESIKPPVDHLAQGGKLIKTGRGFLKAGMVHIRAYPGAYPRQFVQKLLAELEKELFSPEDENEPNEE